MGNTQTKRKIVGRSWTPLWSTIVNSSLWGEPKEVKVLFVTMLALKDADGVVWGTLDGMARLSNLTLEETREAMRVLESPDTRSDTKQDYDGRRVEVVDGGWSVLNHTKYREMIRKIRRKAEQADWQKDYRMHKKLEQEMRQLDERQRKIEWLESLGEEQRLALLRTVPLAESDKAGSVIPGEGDGKF